MQQSKNWSLQIQSTSNIIAKNKKTSLNNNDRLSFQIF